MSDPRGAQLSLQALQTELRLRNLAAERLPVLSAEGLAQHQSDVAAFAFPATPGQARPTPPHNTYDAFLRVQQVVLDPTLRPRQSAERAQLEESQARVRTTLFALREEVNESFFTAALLQARGAELDATIAELETRLRETAMRVRERVVLPSDTLLLRATLLQRRQDRAELRANRSASLAVLSELTGQPIAEDAALAMPDLTAAVARARASVDGVRARPEYEQFARTRERLARQEDVVSAEERPRVSAFARVGYGLPGLKVIPDRFDAYWLAGVQVQWRPWTWRAVDRERAALALQQEIVAADEAAFRERIARAVERDIANADRLAETLALDDQIIGLRTQIEAEARVRFAEGVLMAADYVERTTDLLEARLARARHQVELAQTQARFLTTLGLELR